MRAPPLVIYYPLERIVEIPEYNRDLRDLCRRCRTGPGVGDVLIANEIDYSSLLISMGEGLLFEDLNEIGVPSADTEKIRRMLLSYHSINSLRSPRVLPRILTPSTTSLPKADACAPTNESCSRGQIPKATAAQRGTGIETAVSPSPYTSPPPSFFCFSLKYERERPLSSVPFVRCTPWQSPLLFLFTIQVSAARNTPSPPAAAAIVPDPPRGVDEGGGGIGRCLM